MRALLLTTLALCSARAAAQPLTLTLQSPSPTGRDLGGVAFVTPSHGFVVGDNHHLLETLDGGATWIARMTDELSTDPFYTITFPDALHGYIAGNNQDAYRTSNGGQTWTQMPNFPAGSTRQFDFISPTRGFAGLNGALVFTPDGGTTWEVRSVFPDGVITFGMDFRDENLGLIAGLRSSPYNDQGLYRTSDGGRTATHVGDYPLNHPIWISQTSALAVGGVDVMRSDDEGVTWYVSAPGAILDGAVRIARAGETDVLCTVSGNGSVWRSPDLGYSWYKVLDGMGTLPADWTITFADATTGYVVGASGLTFKTIDAGEHWDLLNSGCGDEVQDIEFFNEQFGLAVTHNGYVFRTTDGGGHWSVSQLKVTGQVFGRSEGLGAVSILDANTAMVGGQGGLCFLTFDGGQTWQNVGFPFALPSMNITDVFLFDEATAYVGSDSGLWRTEDLGSSWQQVPGPMGYCAAIQRVGDRIWYATAGDAVDRSFNAGATWTRSTIPGGSVGIADMKFVDNSTGFIAGRFGTLAKTTNGGVSWTTLPLSGTESLVSIDAVSASEIYATGADSTNFQSFYKVSTNGGSTWTRYPHSLGYAQSIGQVEATPAGRVYFGGNVGKILASPAVTIRASLPGDVPRFLAPGVVTPISLSITEGLETVQSATMWLQRSTGGPYLPVSATHLAGEAWEARVPALRCGDRPSLYFTIVGSGGATVRLPSGSSTYAPAVGVQQTGDILNTTFESGLPSGWSASGLWHVSSSCAPTGLCGSGQRAYFGIDGQCNFNNGARVTGSLTSAPVNLPLLASGQSLTLSYCHSLDTQNPENGVSDFDKAEVWVIHSAGRNPVDLPTDSSTSRVRSASLAQYAGQTIRLEFKFDSVSNAGNAFRGWHVDNVRVVGPVTVCTDPCPADWNGDGGADADDVIAFFGDWDANGADFNGDGGTDSDDVIGFFTAWDGGC